MYRIYLSKNDNKRVYEELVKVFLKNDEFQIIGSEEDEEFFNQQTLNPQESIINIVVPEDLIIDEDPDKKENEEKNQVKRYLYNELSRLTNQKPDWGIFTGIRPVKNTAVLFDRENDYDKVKAVLTDGYLVSEEKADMLIDIEKNQRSILKESEQGAVGIYIGIPFCPTRCLYCSFPSNQGNETQMDKYLEALYQEISYVSDSMKNNGMYPETIYVGGGTPTTLSAENLDKLIEKIKSSFELKGLKEFTIEAGRPDTVTEEKIRVLKSHDINRISINPQSMKAKTLKLIGRNHSPEDIKNAFELARKHNIEIVNTDIIAGLPEETVDEYIESLREILLLEPENITVHTLAIKRASNLKKIDSQYNYKQGQIVRQMLDEGRKMILEAGYKPYYLYRQKQMTGNFENVGYAKPNTEGIYNIRIMEESQTIIALGAGGITKVFYKEENRLERVPNVSNFEIYIERISEMIERKEKNLF